MDLSRQQIDLEACPQTLLLLLLLLPRQLFFQRTGSFDSSSVAIGSALSSYNWKSSLAEQKLASEDSHASLERSFALLESLGHLSGLRVNREKTEVLWIGSKKGSNQIICPEKNLKWAHGKVKALGVWFCTDQNEGMTLNYEDKVQKVKGILNN